MEINFCEKINNNNGNMLIFGQFFNQIIKKKSQPY